MTEDMGVEKKDIGITVKKNEDFSEWYQQAIIKSEFADYSAVSGCMVYRPNSYLIWEKITRIIDEKLKKTGVQNCYFPLFIPEHLLNKESTHLEGFSPEVAWVTHAGNTKLDERLAIRPTSETIMYDSFTKWIRSWRDLPLKTAQWNNVVRWEFKHPVPFLRGREFLWVEGHTVFASKQEAVDEGKIIIDIWEDFLKNDMGIAFFTGKKSKRETFAGAEYTISVESLLPNGKAIQGPDFHHDGQIFAKVYNIKFLNKEGNSEFAYQNTWAISTRNLGIMLAIHGDDKGLIIPPRLAITQIVIVPILFDDTMEKVLAKCTELKEEFSKHHLSAFVDDRNYKPGWKFNEWELKGIPLRIEIGPKDLIANHAVLVRRDTREKETVKHADIVTRARALLNEIQKNLYERSKKHLEESIASVDNMDDFIEHINNNKIVFAPYCDNPTCEEKIKEETGTKPLNMPLDQNLSAMKDKKCFACGSAAHAMFYFGRSY
jgi:prolyl-tRNA synthetase